MRIAYIAEGKSIIKEVHSLRLAFQVELVGFSAIQPKVHIKMDFLERNKKAFHLLKRNVLVHTFRR